ncbi:MAG TPA: hypothetical protein VGF56_02125 [Rhizomicrobium sp.]|jgi:hypothetical protein
MLDQATARVQPEESRFRHSIQVAEVQNPLLLKGLELWRRQKRNERFPSRAAMSPRLLAGLLRHTILVRVTEDDFEFRIVGDAVVTAQGASYQGLTTAQIDAASPGYGHMLGKVYRHIRQAGEPSAYRGWFVRAADGRAFFHESIGLPLGENGNVDHLLIFGVYAYNHDQALG